MARETNQQMLRMPAPSGGSLSLTLPDEWHLHAARRLVWIGAICTVTCLIGLVFGLLFMQPNVGARAGTLRPLWLLPMGTALSLAIFFVARSPRIPAARRVDAGLIYLVVACFAMAYFRHSLPYLASDVMRGLSPVTLAIVFFAVIVPVRPTRMGAAALAAALTDPLALYLTIRAGNPTPPWNLWLWLFFPNAVGVVLAVISARVLYALGQSVTRAREMGAYRLMERLGVGGMGEVWRAEHRSLARPAAVATSSWSRAWSTCCWRTCRSDRSRWTRRCPRHSPRS